MMISLEVKNGICHLGNSSVYLSVLPGLHLLLTSPPLATPAEASKELIVSHKQEIHE